MSPFHTSDGVGFRVRAIGPGDAERERDFIRRMSPQSRYLRFMHHVGEPDDKMIGELVNVDHHRNEALVAVIGKGADERIIGVARYSATSADECEFAVTVADDWQCRGVGTTLVPLLFERAAQEGFRVIFGTVLADNARMIELAEWLGLTVEPPRPGETTVRAWRLLANPAAKDSR